MAKASLVLLALTAVALSVLPVFGWHWLAQTQGVFALQTDLAYVGGIFATRFLCVSLAIGFFWKEKTITEKLLFILLWLSFDGICAYLRPDPSALEAIAQRIFLGFLAYCLIRWRASSLALR